MEHKHAHWKEGREGGKGGRGEREGKGEGESEGVGGEGEEGEREGGEGGEGEREGGEGTENNLIRISHIPRKIVKLYNLSMYIAPRRLQNQIITYVRKCIA